MANIDLLLYDERHNENYYLVIATKNDLFISEFLTTAPLSKIVPTQEHFLDDIDNINSTPMDIDQMFKMILLDHSNRTQFYTKIIFLLST